MNPRNKPSSTVCAVSVLVDIRRSLEDLLDRVDEALGDHGDSTPRSPRRFQVPVTQTYPEGMDFRDDPEGLRHALVKLHDRTTWVEAHLGKFSLADLHQEMCLFAAKARLLQVQSAEDSREWETAVGVIRRLTRIVSDSRPGFVYGLASTHNTNWGVKIQEILESYTPAQ